MNMLEIIDSEEQKKVVFSKDENGFSINSIDKFGNVDIIARGKNRLYILLKFRELANLIFNEYEEG